MTAELDGKLRELFAVVDRAGSGSIGIEEFVDAKKALCGDEEAFDLGAVTGEFLELGLAGAMDFGEFYRWQVEELSQASASHREMMDEVDRQISAISRARRRSRSAAGAGSTAARSLRQGGADEDSIRAERIVELGQALRGHRIRRRSDPSARPTDEEEEAARQLKELMRQRKAELKGKLIIHGSAMCKMEPVAGASVSLLHNGKELLATSSDTNGSFELRLEADLGRACVLEVVKPGFAKASRRVAGEGVKTLRTEMMRLTVAESFQATPGSEEKKTYVDPASGAQFVVPTGQIMKDGVPFDGDVEFSAAVVDVGSPAGLQAMPPLAGQSVGGACRPMQTMGCVYANLQDDRDGSQLALDPNGSGISVRMTAAVEASKTQPSVWRYDEVSGQWVQTSEPLVVNGSELDPPDPDSEGTEPVSTETEASEAREEAQEESLQEGRQKLDEQRRAEGAGEICSCGFQCKEAIMPLVQAREELCRADPPKRIFAATEKVAGSSAVRPVYEFQTEEQRRHGAELAAANRELILSHHLSSACCILGDPVKPTPPTPREADEAASLDPEPEDGAEEWPQGSALGSAWWKLPSTREALPHLAAICDFLVAGAEAHALRGDEGPKDGVPVAEAGVDETVVKLKALELLAGYWAKPERDRRGAWCPGPTLHEMVSAFYDCGEDVGEALLFVASQQARRQEIKEVRHRVSDGNTDVVVPSDVVSKVLDEVGGDVRQAVEVVRRHPVVVKHKEKFSARKELFKSLPMAHPKSSEVEKALADAGGDVKAAAKLLAEDPKVQEDAERVKLTWTETIAEANDRMDLEFGVWQPGFVNVDAPVQGGYEPGPGLRIFTNYREFWPRRPPPLCAERDHSMVMGLFDDGVGAARAVCVAHSYVTVETAEEVQPDGTFSLCCVGSTRFDLTTTKADGTEGSTYGPFYSASRGDVKNLGLLEIPRDDDVRWDDLAASMQITLPPLEFPSATAGGGTDKWEGTYRLESEEEEEDITVGLSELSIPRRFTITRSDGPGYRINFGEYTVTASPCDEDAEGEDPDELFFRYPGNEDYDDGGWALQVDTRDVVDGAATLIIYAYISSPESDDWMPERVYGSSVFKDSLGERCTCFG